MQFQAFTESPQRTEINSFKLLPMSFENGWDPKHLNHVFYSTMALDYSSRFGMSAKTVFGANSLWQSPHKETTIKHSAWFVFFSTALNYINTKTGTNPSHPTCSHHILAHVCILLSPIWAILRKTKWSRMIILHLRHIYSHSQPDTSVVTKICTWQFMVFYMGRKEHVKVLHER